MNGPAGPPNGSSPRQVPPVSLTPYPDGPVVLRGPFQLVDAGGAPVRTRRRAVALCRCGRSRLGSLCDGTHRSAGFRAPGGAPRRIPPVVTVPLRVDYR